jgi:hypothetical protein
MNAKSWSAIAVCFLISACGAKQEEAADVSADVPPAASDGAAGGGGSVGDAGAAAGDAAAPADDAGAAADDAAEFEMPWFPWPPPTPTTQTVLARSLLMRNSSTLGEVAIRLTTALDGLGYSEHSFYAAPGGFALATRLEQIEFDGTPKGEPLRWSAELPPKEYFSLGSLIDALFSAPEGHYRVIVFVVNDQPFTTSARNVTQAEAGAWLQGGMNRLPDLIAAVPLDDGYVGTALIYQFRRVGQAGAAAANPDGAEPAIRHLERSGILAALGG